MRSLPGRHRPLFRQLTFVHITDRMPSYMSHFQCGVDAIIESSTLTQGSWEYSVFLLRDGRIYTSVAWYEEDQLTELKHQDLLEAINLIQEYKEYGELPPMRNVNTEVARR